MTLTFQSACYIIFIIFIPLPVIKRNDNWKSVSTCGRYKILETIWHNGINASRPLPSDGLYCVHRVYFRVSVLQNSQNKHLFSFNALPSHPLCNGE